MEDELPVRQFMDDPDTTWAHGRPNFGLVDKKYLKEKTRSHKAESLEKIVENLVKTWEMESSHKIDEKDWKCVDKDVFTISTNAGAKETLQDNIGKGNYGLFLRYAVLYDGQSESNLSSHKLFKQAFPGGFAWELLDLFSGPPNVTFTWRHWGTFEGPFKGHEPTGKIIDLVGMCHVKVTDDLKIQTIEVYYDPNPMLAMLQGMEGKCPLSAK